MKPSDVAIALLNGGNDACVIVLYVATMLLLFLMAMHQLRQYEAMGTEDSVAADDQLAVSDGAQPKKDEASDLWKPHPPTEDCPVCLVPLSLEGSDSMYWPCCRNLICDACVQEHSRAFRESNAKRIKKELPPLERTCAFCRVPGWESPSELVQRYQMGSQKGDGHAMLQLAICYRDGEYGLPKNEAKALEHYHRAVDLGSAGAMSQLGYLYAFGDYGVAKDEVKGREYLEAAAKKGDVDARKNLGVLEFGKGNTLLAIRHYRLAAAAGNEKSMKNLWDCFCHGEMSKADLEETLRAHKGACDEMNSEERSRLAAAKEAVAGNDEMLKELYRSYYGGELNAKELKKALKCSRGGKWNEEELNKILMAARARLEASGII